MTTPNEDPAEDAQRDPLNLAGTQLLHYRVHEYIGGGGMGVVYRAEDTRLQREVALKFLPALHGQDAAARERFLVEARAASKLDHPNICTVYEIGETEGGRVFIAMAYYAGETLKAKVARGPLPLGLALDYATQVARGLGRAHAAGIVHRDIKPANVMITDDHTAKVLDFGTAKVGDLELTQTGRVVGTLWYMSPEQAEGLEVDSRTDIWAVGALIYEMLAGTAPFAAATAQRAVYSLLAEDPQPLSSHRVSVPPSVEQLIQTCLAKQRDDRFENAEALAAALERVAEDSGVSGVGPRTPRITRSPEGKRRVAVGAALGGLALASLLLVPALRSAFGGGDMASVRSYVAVLPFTSSAAGDAVMATGLTYSLTGMISSLLTDSDSLWLVPSGEIAGQGIQTASQARQLFPVRSVLQGNLNRVGDTQEVVIDLVDPVPAVPTLVASAVLPPPSDAAFQARARSVLSDLLDLSPVAVGGTSSGAPAANPQAYPYYLRARGYLLSTFDNTALANAVALFEQAIAEDPNFAPAHAGLCEALWEQFRDLADRAVAERGVSSCDRAARLAGDDPTILVSVGSVYLRTGEFEKAEETLMKALDRDPENAEGFRWLGRVYERDSQFERAAEAYTQAIALRPEIWTYFDDLAVMHAYTGELDQAKELYDEVIRLSPDNYYGYNGAGIVSLFMGDTDSAERHFRLGLSRQENALGYRNLAHLRLRDRDYTAAVVEAERGLALNEGDVYAWRWLGHAQHFLGRAQEAEAALRSAIALESTRLAVNPRDIEALIGLAQSHAILGEMAVARGYQERLSGETLPWGSTHHSVASIHELLGERDLALRSVENALEAGLHPSALEENPWLDGLREDPRYGAIRSRE